MNVLGIDIGGTGIKGAPVDTIEGQLLEERFRLLTPQPSTPEAVSAAIGEIARHFNWTGKIGCGYPGVIKEGVVMTAANVNRAWIGVNGAALVEQATQCETRFVNDADAAGMAELQFGSARGHKGVVMMITVGTGIGTALFVNGHLLPNTEFGHLQVRGKDAEHRASERVRVEKELSWKSWAKRLDEYLLYMDTLFWPDLIIIGGGVSKNFAKFVPYLTLHAKLVPAHFLNDAGILGAALIYQQT
jgi:polyphosphate glucokinase